jgi:hypothetical protein
VIDDLSVDSINQALDQALEWGETNPRAASEHLLERNTLTHFMHTLQTALRENAGTWSADECREGAAA